LKSQHKQLQRVSRYHIHIANPFPGGFKNTASHELDVAFLLGNFHAHPSLSSHDQKMYDKLGDEMRNVFINYAWGEGWASSSAISSSPPSPSPLIPTIEPRRYPSDNILHPPTRTLPPTPLRPLENPRGIRPLFLHDERNGGPHSEFSPSNRLQSKPAHEDPKSDKDTRDPGHDDQDLVTVFTAQGIRKMSDGEYDRVFRRGRGRLLSSFSRPERLWRLVEGWQGVRSEEEVDAEDINVYVDSRVSGRYSGRERAKL
jgi:hypothetical protein